MIGIQKFTPSGYGHTAARVKHGDNHGSAGHPKIGDRGFELARATNTTSDGIGIGHNAPAGSEGVRLR